MDLISIILPYYKKKSFIRKTIKSILNQSYSKFELIMIYDDHDKKDLIYLKRLIKNDARIQLIINTTQDTQSLKDSHSIRKAAIRYKVPYITTISAAKLAITSINVMINQKIQVKSLQEYYKE